MKIQILLSSVLAVCLSVLSNVTDYAQDFMTCSGLEGPADIQGFGGPKVVESVTIEQAMTIECGRVIKFDGDSQMSGGEGYRRTNAIAFTLKRLRINKHTGDNGCPLTTYLQMWPIAI